MKKGIITEEELESAEKELKAWAAFEKALDPELGDFAQWLKRVREDIERLRCIQAITQFDGIVVGVVSPSAAVGNRILEERHRCWVRNKQHEHEGADTFIAHIYPNIDAASG